MTALPIPTATRLADEAPLALLAVLHRALERARLTEGVLELESTDPRVAELFRDAKALRKSIGALIAEVAIEAAEVRG